MRGDRHRSLAATENCGTPWPDTCGEFTSEFGRSDRYQLGVETAHLLNHQLQVVSSRHRDHTETFGKAADDIQCRCTNRASRAEDRDGLHGGILDFRQQLPPPTAVAAAQAPSVGSSARTCGIEGKSAWGTQCR